jgi:hypothetical protein
VNFRLWSARGAICFAPLVVAQVVARNWGGWESWPYWLDDSVAAVLLIVGGYLSLDSDTTTNSRALTGAWGFAIATLWISMFRMMEKTVMDDPTPVWLVTLTLVSFLGSVVGGVGSLPSKRLIAGGGNAKPAAKPQTKSRSRSSSSSSSKAK